MNLYVKTENINSYQPCCPVSQFLANPLQPRHVPNAEHSNQFVYHHLYL